jgi:Ca2+-dependent lipid-binding protein
VWKTKELKMMDAEGTCDAYVRVFFDSTDDRETDTHFRNTDGNASWNYRILFNHDFPNKDQNYTMTVQCYDRDLLDSNDLVGEYTIDLEPIFKDVELIRKPLGANKKY